jgi:hypothetical protein
LDDFQKVVGDGFDTSSLFCCQNGLAQKWVRDGIDTSSDFKTLVWLALCTQKYMGFAVGQP